MYYFDADKGTLIRLIITVRFMLLPLIRVLSTARLYQKKEKLRIYHLVVNIKSKYALLGGDMNVRNYCQNSKCYAGGLCWMECILVELSY